MIKDDKTLTLTPDQQKEVKEGLKHVQRELAERVRRTYRQLFIPAREGLKELDLGIPTYGEDRPLDEEVYEKLQMDGEVLEHIAPLVIRERYLRDQEYVLTEQLVQAGLRTPGEIRVISRHAWQEGIAQGVKQKLFGLETLEEGRPVCRYFGPEEEPFVQLTSDEVIIQAEVCQAQWEAKLPPPHKPPEGSMGKTVAEDTGGEEIVPPEIGKPEGKKGPEGTRRQLRLRFNVPKGEVSSLMGVMNLLQYRFGRLEVTLAAEAGEMSEQEYEDKILEAFRQLGIEIREE